MSSYISVFYTLLSRFSWYRQGSGGSYFITIRNLFYTEKRIKVIMLLKEGVKLSTVLSDPTVSEGSVSEDERKLIEMLDGNLEGLDDFQSRDRDIIFSVAGYVTSFVSCNCFEPPDATSLLVDTSHFDALNRGGWTYPLPTILFICTVATRAFNILVRDDNNRQFFLSLRHHRHAFCESLRHLLLKDIPSLSRCNHVSRILAIFFNCLSKNFLKNMEMNVYDASCFKKIQKMMSASK